MLSHRMAVDHARIGVPYSPHVCRSSLCNFLLPTFAEKRITHVHISTDWSRAAVSHCGGGGELCWSGLMSSVTSLRRMGMAYFGGGNDVETPSFQAGNQMPQFGFGSIISQITLLLPSDGWHALLGGKKVLQGGDGVMMS